MNGKPYTRKKTASRRLPNRRIDIPDRYRSLFEMCPVGIFVAARSGEVMEANEVASSLLGYDVGGMAGADIQEICVVPPTVKIIFRGGKHG